MAILPPNYTQIPNVIVDVWMQKLSPTAFKVLICLCRKTFGWHKTYDAISKNQLVTVTGMTKKTVTAAVGELEKNELVKTTHHSSSKGNESNTYQLNIYTPIEEEVDEGVGEILPQGGRVNFTPPLGEILPPQKKDLTKERREDTPLTPSKEGGGGGEWPPEIQKISEKPTINYQTLKAESKKSFGEHENCKLTELEHEKLLKRFGSKEVADLIENIDLESEKQGPSKFNLKYKSHYATILSWKRREEKIAASKKSNYNNGNSRGDPLARHRGLNHDHTPLNPKNCMDLSEDL